MSKVCPGISSRAGAFTAGILNVITGVTHVTVIAILLLVLDPQLLWKTSEKDEGLEKRESFGRVLFVYFPPAIFTLASGALLFLAAHNNDRMLSEVSFLVTTVYVCGLGLEIVSLKLYGLQWLHLGPMIALLIIQIFIFVIAANYRDHLNRDGRLVRASMDRRRLSEEPLDDSELSRFQPAAEETTVTTAAVTVVNT